MSSGHEDFVSEVTSALSVAGSFTGGADAAKPAAPVSKDIYLATDTQILYVCLADGVWTNSGQFYLLLAGGTMSGAIAMGTNKITGLAAPAADGDAARKLDVDTVNARLDDVTHSSPARAIDTIYQNTSGKLKLVTVMVRMDVGEYAYIQYASSSPPSTKILVEDNSQTVSFIVPVNWYYRVATGSGPLTAPYWEEWDLL